MVYSSLLFIYIFLPVSLLIYCVSPKKFKDIVLLVESLIFCSTFGLKLLFFMILYCAVNYSAARLIFSSRPKLQFIPLLGGLIFDAAALAAFRTDYFSSFQAFINLPEGIYPVGISLFSLSAVGYLLDAYNGNIRADKNFVRFSLFIMMFPRLIMGPIVSYDNFVSIMKRRRINMAEIGSGFNIFLKGLAKKILAADSLYKLYFAVNSTDTSKLSAAAAWLGIFAYVLCLYFTLSGFSDMGVGISRCFGFRFPKCFNYPMFSGRIRLFTSRWHIQVIHWFRKYITRPLSSMTESHFLSKLLFICVWMLAGFWYGFNRGSAVWGLLMGTAIIIENKLRKFKFLKSNGMIYTLFTVIILSVFLSEGDIFDAFAYLWAMIGGNGLLLDSEAAYMLRSYIVIMLISAYASTDLFKNTVTRLNTSNFKWIVSLLKPAAAILALLVCTSLMAYHGQASDIIINL